MAKIVRDDVDRFFQFGVELNSRTIYMGSLSSEEDGESGVDHEMAEHVIKGLHILDSSAPQGDKPITIIMNNPGGDIYHGRAIFDAIKACVNHVKIVVYGCAMSMGSIILQAADERVVAPNATLMVHYGQFGYHDHPKISQKWVEESKRFNKWLVDLFLAKIRKKHPKFSRKKVDDMCNFDTFFDAKKAVELGLADKVLEVHDQED